MKTEHVWTLALCALCLLEQTALGQSEVIRFKRQAVESSGVQQNARRPPPPSAQQGPKASSSGPMAISSASSGAISSAGGLTEPVDVGDRPMEAAVDDEREPPRRQPPRKQVRRPNKLSRRPPPARVEPMSNTSGDEYEVDEDCEEYDSREPFNFGHEMFAPMRHMRRMMGDMFDHIQGMADGYGSVPTGPNMAMASSYSNRDGDSRVASIVNNNGRTRGIISETRNGRVTTRRIGDDDDNYEE